MQLRSALILSSLLLTSGVGYYVSIHGSNVVEDGPVALALGEALENPKVRTVDYGKLAQFPYSDMHVFEPFSNRNDICRTVGLTGWDCLQKVPFQVDSGHYFLVFRQQTDVVHREYQAVKHGRFVGVLNGYRSTDLSSAFTVVRNFSARDADGRPQTFLAPQRQGILTTAPR